MTAVPSPARGMAADAAWNYAALAATAGVGAATTFGISWQMGAAALGVFAQLYAVHVIGAQLAVFGAHDSTQKHVAELDGDGQGDDAVVVGALELVLLSAMVLAGALAALGRPIGEFVSSPDVGAGLLLVAPGIVCFALNKVLFGAINGRGALRLYAWMQLVRAVFVLTAVGGLLALDLPAFAVGGIFTVAEVLLLPVLLGVVRPSWRRARATAPAPRWWTRHLGFGGRGLVNGILLETHLRVDVMTLSYFVSDRAVGVYAFASLFAEGIYQVPVVMRTVAYPTLVRLASRLERVELARTVRRLSLASGLICAAVAAVVGLAYPLVAGWFDAEFVDAGWPVLQVLLLGMVVYAFFAPFDQLLLQSGLPGRQSVLMAAYVGVNVGLNLVLIPRFGLMGAALGTSLALVAAGGLLLMASHIWLGYRGGVLLYKAPSP
jgi:O-antigen/teichoic acid export membrane protein